MSSYDNIWLHITLLLLFCLIIEGNMSDNLPTLYEYYTSDGIKTGLSDQQPRFALNNKQINIYSAAIHYFRVPPEYWRDRLRKARAAGLNAVETYVSWNLHEPEIDIAKFVNIAKEEDLFVIVRPGPYICAEWEFGGLPSWLLRYDMKVRTSDPKFMDLVKKYYAKLLSILAPLQFTKGGPIIAFQIENEYGNTKVEEEPVDIQYLEGLKTILQENGIVELLFTSDTPSNGFWGTIPNVLATANFQEEPEKELNLLKEFQPNKPLMVMEFWTGWFDHWGEHHNTRTVELFGSVLEKILLMNSSFNLYMFHGGTNWGLLNGANIIGNGTDNSLYVPDITSYDYDAPLTEAGDYTAKYYKLKELLQKYESVKLKLPDMPELVKRVAYETIEIVEELSLTDAVKQVPSYQSHNIVSMEKLEINNASGQSYGYIVYRKEHISIKKNSILKIQGHVCDTVLVLINGKLVSKILNTLDDIKGFGYWFQKDSTLELTEDYENATLDLVVENYGRVNYGKLNQFNQFNQFKGLWQGDVLIDDRILRDWLIYPIEFKRNWINSLSNWKTFSSSSGPRLYKGVLQVDKPKDTYIDMRKWSKGIIIVNGFVLARYLHLGPQQSAYLPASFLHSGSNEIIIFEHFTPNNHITFTTDLIFSNN